MYRLLVRIVCVIIGYGFGLFQTAFIYGKMHGIDIRKHGSGNSGTTNALRVLGKKAGLITFIGDVFKAVVCSAFIKILFHSDSKMLYIYVLYAGLGVVLGHNFPFYMNFKGGKGVAATGGVIIALGDARVTLIGFALFFCLSLITRYVSLGSIVAVTSLIISTFVFNQTNHPVNHWPTHKENQMEAYILIMIFIIFVLIRHRENIKRLLNGTERKLGVKEA